MNKSEVANDDSVPKEDKERKEENINTFRMLPFLQKLKVIVRNITVEPVIFLLGLSMAMSFIIMPSFLMEKICFTTLSYSDEQCRNLRANVTLEKEAQNLAANLNMWKIVIETIPAVLFTLFLGPWSDRYGRKITLIFPTVGGLLSTGLLVALAYFKTEIPANVLLLAAFTQSLAGGIMGIVSLGGCYLSDITSPEQRTTRLAILQVSFLVAISIGSSLSGMLYEMMGGYITVFTVAFIINIIAFVYILCLVKETIAISAEDKLKNPFLMFFNVQNLIDNYKTVTKKRDKNQRTHLMLVFGISFINTLLWTGEAAILYLYLRWKFLLSEMHFSLLLTITLIIDFLGLMAVPFFTDFLRIPATILGVASGISRILVSLSAGLSSKLWMIFAAIIFNFLIDVYVPVTRSICSQSVSSKEQGKVFSIIAALEASAPVVASVIYTQVYNQTLLVLPSAAFFMSAGIGLLALAMISYLAFDRRKFDCNIPGSAAEMKVTST